MRSIAYIPQVCPAYILTHYYYGNLECTCTYILFLVIEVNVLSEKPEFDTVKMPVEVAVQNQINGLETGLKTLRQSQVHRIDIYIVFYKDFVHINSR